MTARILAIFLFCAGLLCVGQAPHAQIPITGAGLGVVPSSGGGLLLDSVSATAVGAFSSRKLRTAYAGNALTVKRSSDNATQAIGFTSNNLNTTSLATFVGANNGTTTTWNDQSVGGPNNAAAATAGPTIVASGTNNTENSHVCLKYSNAASTGLNWAGSLVQAQPYTLAFMFHLSGAPVSGAHLNDGSTNRNVLGFFSGAYDEFAGSAGITGGTVDTNAHTIFGIFNGASSSIILDGSTIATGSPGTNAFGGGGDTKSIGYSIFSSLSIDGNLCEFITFVGSLSGGDQTIVRTSWQTYWGAP